MGGFAAQQLECNRLLKTEATAFRSGSFGESLAAEYVY